MEFHHQLYEPFGPMSLNRAEMASGASGTETDNDTTDSSDGSYDEGNAGSLVGSEVPEHDASFAYTLEETGVNEPDYVAINRCLNKGSSIKSLSKKRRLDDDVPELKSAKKINLTEDTTISSYGDTCDSAESHFAANADRSGHPSHEKTRTWKNSKDNFKDRVVPSSETIQRERQVPDLKKRIECPFKGLSSVLCGWVGSQSDLVGHSTKGHGAEVQEKSGPFVVKLQNVSESRRFYKAIAMWGHLFYLRWVKKEDTMHFLVYVIPKQTSEEFTYDFKLKKDQEEISITGSICSSILQPRGEGKEKGDIIRLHGRTVQKYLDTEDNLSCIIEIRRQKETSSSGEADKAREPGASK